MAAALHLVAIILAVTIPWRHPFLIRYVTLTPLEPGDSLGLVPFGGTRPVRGLGASASRPRRAITQLAPLPASPVPQSPAPDTSKPAPLPVSPPSVSAPGLVLQPRLGDGRLWVSPRPALPAGVAEALYGGGDTLRRDSVVVRRLRTMVDSLNQLLDVEQREHRLPSWTAEVSGAKFGIDSQFIYVAGIKIPTMALALLPISLPQGNFGEIERARQLEDMREDLLRAAARAQAFDDFRRYVRELRARKQAERDAEKRQKGDTVKAVP